ncbi:MAG: DUF4097 family beta strand repeat-containing protein [Candidatus Coproplasma sp.]
MKIFKKFTALTVVALFAVALCAVCGCGIISGKLWTDVSYDNESAYTVGGGEITDTITEIEIDWSDDGVTVKYYQGDCIKVEETADKEIEEGLKLRYLVDNGKLTVQFATNGRHDIRGLNKKLNVLVPDGLTLDKLTVENVSGEIDAQIAAKELKAETTTGNVTVGGSVQTIDTKTVSGRITVRQTASAIITAVSVTSDIDVSFDAVGGLVAGTVSGKVNISLPETFGFELTLDTTSGKLNTELELTLNNNKYTRLDGGAIFSVNTVTGNVTIAKKS